MKRLMCFVLLTSVALAAGDAPAGPKTFFQGDFFGEMARSFGVVQKADPAAKTITVKLDKDAKIVTLPIHDDTELHFRDSWGEIADFYPGQHVLLFMYIDDEKSWTYPRAVQDDLHFRSGHNRYAKIVSIDAAARTIKTRREEKNSKGEVKAFDEEIVFAPDVKVWKSAEATGLDSLQAGDEIIHQLVEKEGKLVATELLTKAGDAAVRAAQDLRHKAEQDASGLVAYVNDFEILNGSLTASIAWSSSARGKELKVGDSLRVEPAGGKAFAAQVLSVQPVDQRQRVQFLINSRVAARLARGQSLRLFLPGTGGPAPDGRVGVPVAK